MDNILEIQRKNLELIDIFEQSIVNESLKDTKNFKTRLIQQHNINTLLNQIKSTSSSTLENFDDKESILKREVHSLSGPNEISEFYNRLKSIKEYHRSNSTTIVENLKDRSSELTENTEDKLEGLFSGEEYLGKFLDLNQIFVVYQNLQNLKKLNYLSYLDQFYKFEIIDRKLKGGQYKEYLKNLKEYLESYFKRAKPLYNLEALQSDSLTKFNEHLEKGTVPGWDNLDLKSKEKAINLFCKACNKTFEKETVFEAHMKSLKHKKSQAKYDANPDNQKGDEQKVEEEAINQLTEIPLLEFQISSYCQVLQETIDDTKANVERKQALTDRERRIELEQEEIDDIESDEEDSAKLYNPLKLPLGWDGKPIPYWLFKLHGLGIEYPCEICGNYVYMGRKSFEKHFQEFRHAHGMRCLGIPNTRHFYEITKIQDAYDLWNKLKKNNSTEKFVPDTMEEFEDDSGNVFNRKTYEDLKRQGLL
ncbi:splicing factor 3A subunit 3-like protein [Conidiobolus coronatus NRRL 28638]|uniref:Splicing factor 3A subunit 3-like protein n=1 Tax=Conidiobolus coronatus (strain ATCC 28846 / CBS 209.66 / NRRL 28638) TaxID=796925 RepID=A0A137PHU3_CONC2|nr:splicing factor 3A subunit 3-like protein [Conidiobolus coronatus NRRL 28638]|eukprot:KXN74573.1 splicing factor 3A subunit 3-like protein [Conidiobolus coronatus NRRL 28638]